MFPLSDERSGNDQSQAVKDLVRGASKYGLEVQSVIRFKQVINKKFSIQDLSLHQNGVVYDVPIFGFRDLFLRWPTALMLKRCFSNREVDLVICHLTLNALRLLKICSLENIPKMLIVHRSDLNNSYLSKCISKFDIVVARSYAIKKSLEKEFFLKDVPVAYSGIPECFYNKDNSKDLTKVNNSCVLIYAGNLIALKNIDSVLYAIRILINLNINITFEIYGTGPKERELEELARDLKIDINVHFHGWIRREKLPSKYSKSDLFVMPSKPETFGLVYLEAMANGAIILGHKNEGIDGIVQDQKSGLMVDQPSPEEIAKKIIFYLNCSDGQRAEIRKKAYQIACQFNLDKSYQNYYQIASSVVAQQRVQSK